MKYRVRDVMDSIEFSDLVKLKKDIESGGYHIKKMLDEKIKEHQKSHEQRCSFCDNELDPYSVNNYTIIFGPEDFKKKASFDGIDCLESFITKLKMIKRGDVK